ncbi:MAG TPA: hypothetical protein VJ302_12630, partial [Blastocatellia bacterium]|nr:hypothetical protein [Blastocatellia bacterium]
ATLPEIPPQVPLAPPQTAQPLSTWMPVVYDDSHAGPEYRVLTRDSLDAAGWEAELNALGREGWWLVQILPREQQALLVLMRRTSRA